MKKSGAAKGVGMVVVLTVGAAFISACTSGDLGAGTQTIAPHTERPPASEVAAGGEPPCAAVTETDVTGTVTLSWQDVWPSPGGGGEALSAQDLRPCAVSTSDRPASFPLCTLGFPWRTAARADADLAALGVVGVQLKRLVKSSDVTVNERILSFDSPRSAGAAQLVKESIGCAQVGSASQGGDANRTRWMRTQTGARLALVESGSRLIAVEFADATLKQAQLQRIVNKAVDRTVNLG